MIGVIGFGRFGRLTVDHLSADFPVVVSNRSDKREAIGRAGATPGSLADACGQKIVILCVPISQMQTMLRDIAPLLRPGTLVVDVCSVKVYPVRWMQELLPPHVHILATHPMFGPDSAADSLLGRKMVLCPERIPSGRYRRICDYLQAKGLTLISATADAHDRQIAITLSLTHFIGRSLSRFGAPALDIDTEGYKRLRHILGVVENDSWQLFDDMHRYNPYAAEMRRRFTEAMGEIERQLSAPAGSRR